MVGYTLIVVSLMAVASAFPADPVIYKLDEERFQYVTDDEGIQHLADLWVKVSDLRDMARFTPDSQNSYHLFTRNNPSQSQVLLSGNTPTLMNSNYDVRRRTVVLIHGWTNSVTSDFNTVLVPAFLSAEDVNVIVVDWSVGASADYLRAIGNTITSGESVARFLSWLNSVTGASQSPYLIAGHSLGGHQAGIVGRNLGGQVPYIMSLDPASPGWNTNNERFHHNDGIYTEVIHSNAGITGYLTPLGDVDFYPNGGINMPGCNNQNCEHLRCLDPASPGWNTNNERFHQNDGIYTEVLHTNAGVSGYLTTLGDVDFYPNGGINMSGCNGQNCDHDRAFYYFAESVSSGGFTGSRCSTYLTALTGNCDSSDRLHMGGITPKTGHSGVFHVTTNAAPPFSQG